MKSIAKRHARNQQPGTARPSGVRHRYITSPFFDPKEEIMFGKHKYRFSQSLYGNANTQENRDKLRKVVARVRKENTAKGKATVARYMTHGTVCGVVIYTRKSVKS